MWLPSCYPLAHRAVLSQTVKVCDVSFWMVDDGRTKRRPSNQSWVVCYHFFSAPKFWHDECLMIRANVPRKNGDFCSCRPCAPTCRSIIWQLGTYLPSLFFAARMHKWSVILCWLVALTYFSHLQPISGSVLVIGHHPRDALACRSARVTSEVTCHKGHDFPVWMDGWKGKSTRTIGFTVPQNIAGFL